MSSYIRKFYQNMFINKCAVKTKANTIHMLHIICDF